VCTGHDSLGPKIDRSEAGVFKLNPTIYRNSGLSKGGHGAPCRGAGNFDFAVAIAPVEDSGRRVAHPCVVCKGGNLGPMRSWDLVL
jgi:hypothetical protein